MNYPARTPYLTTRALIQELRRLHPRHRFAITTADDQDIVSVTRMGLGTFYDTIIEIIVHPDWLQTLHPPGGKYSPGDMDAPTTKSRDYNLTEPGSVESILSDVATAILLHIPTKK